MSEEGLAAVETRLTSVERRLASVDTRLISIELKQDDLHREIHDLRHDMHVLHEDTISNIRVLAPDFAPIRREFTAADSSLREDIDRRLIPLEAIARKRHRRPGR